MMLAISGRIDPSAAKRTTATVTAATATSPGSLDRSHNERAESVSPIWAMLRSGSFNDLPTSLQLPSSGH